MAPSPCETIVAEPIVPIRRVAIIGTGLIGSSIAAASGRVGCEVRGWDVAAEVGANAAAGGWLAVSPSLEEAISEADLIVVATPIPVVPELVARALASTSSAIVTDAASIKSAVVDSVSERVTVEELSRFVPGHPMGGSERSGPEHASASIVDDIVWVLTPTSATDPDAAARVEAWVREIGGRPVLMPAARHDRLVAFVSHLPQVASTALMGLAAEEEAGEPEILLLAAGGFRDLTRLASSNPTLWSDILLANREQVTAAIDLYIDRLAALRDEVARGSGSDVQITFETAQRARLRLAAKPKVRAGVAVLQVPVPDRPGALAELTAALGAGAVNIEDLQIVHSPEGGRGTVHLTVAASSAGEAGRILRERGFDPVRLA
jgi:prephenate dehydrogenase